MKKNVSKNMLTKQPILKNVSLIGTTMMISSSVLIPGVTTKAYADAAKEYTEESEKELISTKGPAMDLSSFTTENSVVKEEDNRFEMAFVLNAHQVENLDTIIQISPNANLVFDETKLEVKEIRS